MGPTSYLDIHTHLRSEASGSVSVGSLSASEILEHQLKLPYSCAGIHPWWLEDMTGAQVEELKVHIQELLTQGALWGVGETGLDRLYPEFWEQQKELFEWHWDLAENYHLPLVIHNVRAGSDFLELLKKKKATTPWLFHDFRGNEDSLNSLLRLHPQCYFSFGLSLDNSPQVRELLPLVPLENLFLETDNQKHLDIHDIYLRASEQLQLDLDFLKAQLWHNFKKLTPRLQ